ncbi:cytochrome P450 [Thozetella sp. PMI_491]|nr:cytochrome P450 [Thozetella sp. PMI_491]
MFGIFAVVTQSATLFLQILFAGFLSLGFWSIVSLVRHVRLARTTGLPFVVVPCSLLGSPWLLARFILVPLANSLPERLTQSWLPLLSFNEFWHNGYEPFERLKADTFLTVSPGGLILHTCDPEVNVQLFRDETCGKPAELMALLNLYGPTMTGTDGPESRLYRKITAPFFSENTLRRVFAKSVSGAQMLLAALIVFNYQTDSDLVDSLASKDKIIRGKMLSYNLAMQGVVDKMGAVFLMPHWMLRLSPFHTHNHAAACYSDLGSIMDQLKRAREGTVSKIFVDGMSSEEDLLDLLVQAGAPSKGQANPVLTDAQVIGQIFIFMFAGHTANANLLVSILLLLSCHPEVQNTMQRDLDRLLGKTCPDTWTYDENFGALMRTTVGAVINEGLRLFPVVPVLPKRVLPNGPLSITVKGQRHPLPPNLIALINTSATHRHPKYWPKKSGGADQRKRHSWSDIRNDPCQRPYAAADFDPSRWMNPDEAIKAGLANFLRLRTGTFIPFSEGSRGCLGRRFALAQVCAVVATLFKTHSVELVTDPRHGLNGEEEGWLVARRYAALALSEGTRFDTSLRVGEKNDMIGENT